MTEPSKEQIDVAIQALRDDAQKWRAAAGDLEIAAQVAAEMDCQASHFSYIADKIGVTEAYRALQDKLIGLLSGGAANLRGVAQALNTAADGYQEEDHHSVHRFKNIW